MFLNYIDHKVGLDRMLFSFFHYYGESFYTNGSTDPINTSAGAYNKRVRRGGSWNYHASTLLTYARASDFENRGNNHFGFRIVKDSEAK